MGATASGAHAMILEVDRETCDVKIHRYVVVHDCGTVINPLILEGQVHGGVAQGIGNAFYEQLVYDENGQLLNASFMDYLLPTALDVPRMERAATRRRPRRSTRSASRARARPARSRSARCSPRRWRTRWTCPRAASKSARSRSRRPAYGRSFMVALEACGLSLTYPTED